MCQTVAPVVAVLLASVNGARFIDEQLDSLARQSYSSWRLVVSDDGSQDDTLDRVRAFGQRFEVGRVQIRRGPQAGFVQNFLSLVCDAELDADYFAFCDQDDVWDDDRRARSVAALSAFDPTTPALYGARTRSVDVQGQPLGDSPLFQRPPGFKNALVQSLAGGNTMTFNRTARELLRQAGPVVVPAHDWWVYVVVSACGGTVIYDPQPNLAYRQHATNVIGAAAGWADRWQRNREVLRGRLRRWNDMHEYALSCLAAQMSAESREVFECFTRARRSGPLRRLVGVARSGVFRQTRWGQLGLWLAALGGLL